MPEAWEKKLEALIDDRMEETVCLRRELHAHPEPSGKELRTSLKLYQLMDERGLSVQMGPEGCGLWVESRTSNGETEKAKKRIALRADIDALRIEDTKDVSYKSQVPGIMHACGHDAHASILVAAITCLDELQQQGLLPWPITWRGIFQPSEETATGAEQMVHAGALEGIDAVISLHVDPTRNAGTIGIREGLMTANCDSMLIELRGVGGHAARPHLSQDPISAAAQFISTLYQFIPRATDSLDSVVVTIGEIKGGENPNVIPEFVHLQGTLRTLRKSVRESTINHIMQLARGIEEISGTKVRVEFKQSISAVKNAPELTNLICNAFDSIFGEEHRETIARPSMGSEDFSCYLNYVPGVMFRLGSAICENSPGLHTPMFDIDERALGVGAKVLAHSVIAWNRPDSA